MWELPNDRFEKITVDDFAASPVCPEKILSYQSTVLNQAAVYMMAKTNQAGNFLFSNPYVNLNVVFFNVFHLYGKSLFRSTEYMKGLWNNLAQFQKTNNL